MLLPPATLQTLIQPESASNSKILENISYAFSSSLSALLQKSFWTTQLKSLQQRPPKNVWNTAELKTKPMAESLLPRFLNSLKQQTQWQSLHHRMEMIQMKFQQIFENIMK